MTPKEKAIELIDSFESIKNVVLTIIKEPILNKIAKECALICVQEVIDNSFGKWGSDLSTQYWLNVEREIKKL